MQNQSATWNLKTTKNHIDQYTKKIEPKFEKEFLYMKHVQTSCI
jgi:hypothetical protein